jgi:hypothetical protein
MAFTEQVQRLELQEREASFFAIFHNSRIRVEANEVDYNNEVLMRAVHNVESEMRNVIDISSRSAVLGMLSAADESFVAQRRRMFIRIVEEQQVVIDKHIIGCLVLANEESAERQNKLATAFENLKALVGTRPPLRFVVSLHSMQVSLAAAPAPDEEFMAIITASGLPQGVKMPVARSVSGGLTHVLVLAPPDDGPSPSFDFDVSMKSLRILVELRLAGEVICSGTVQVEGGALEGGVLPFVISSEQCNFAKVIFLANIQ